MMKTFERRAERDYRWCPVCSGELVQVRPSGEEWAWWCEHCGVDREPLATAEILERGR